MVVLAWLKVTAAMSLLFLPGAGTCLLGLSTTNYDCVLVDQHCPKVRRASPFTLFPLQNATHTWETVDVTGLAFKGDAVTTGQTAQSMCFATTLTTAKKILDTGDR